jgi:peptidoglycan hydrolase CwlO-like protein
MPKTFQKSLLSNRLRVAALLVVSLGIAGTMAVTHADQFDDQINSLQQDNNAAQTVVNGLESQLQSYQDTVNQFQAQINATQAALNANQARQAQLQQQITEYQTKLDQQKQYLSESLKSMYIDGQMSTIEQLATSKNLSEYVDKQEYQQAIQNKINDSIKEISALQAQLQKEKAQLDALVASEQQQRDQLASAQAQQQALLSYTQGQQDAFSAGIAANRGKIGELRRQQSILNSL